MKPSFVLSLLLATTIPTAFGQQIHNAGLENWQSFTGYQVPDSFWTRDQQEFGFLGVASTEKTTDAHSGQYAAVIKTIPGGILTTNRSGILEFGSFYTIGQTNYFGGWPFIGRPAKITFWFKFVRGGNDTAHAAVALSKWNGNHSFIGFGILSISSNTPNYTQAEVPITYFSNENPDSIIVSFGSSANVNPTPGTMLYVDDISLDYATGVRVEHSQIAKSFALYQNYPNPFNPITTISFTLPSQSFVTLKVFDLIGREQATIVSEEMPAGNYARTWNAEGLASGVYFYRLKAGLFVETKKLLLLK